jgi:hypothetical protein
VAYSDPDFTSVEDPEDLSRDYECGIKMDEDFETSVHESREYFGFFKLVHTCE